MAGENRGVYLKNITTDYVLYFDGASKGNPGIAGSGAVIYDKNGDEYAVRCIKFDKAQTNVVAEYYGLIIGLELALKNNINAITVFGDNEMVVKTMLGKKRVNAEHLKPIFERAKELSRKFSQFNIYLILREYNSRADELANIACASRA